MNEEQPESPLPVPQPYAHPRLSIASSIQLKSLKAERELKKSLTYRNRSKGTNSKEHSLTLTTSHYASPISPKLIQKKPAKNSIIARAKNKNTTEVPQIPYRIINLTRKSICLSPRIEKLKKEFQKSPNFSIFSHKF